MRWAPIAIVFATLAAQAGAQEPPRYADDSAISGIDHSYDGGWEFFVGGGVAAFDCNADGRPDLMFAGGTSPAKLYRNTSRIGGELSFTPVAESPTGLRDVIGVYPLDVDGDGNSDLAVLRVGENVLFRGLGNCRFERANEAWGFAGGDAWSTAFTARWDEGRDWPIVVVGNYVDRAKPGSPWGTCDDNVIMRPAEGGGFSPPAVLDPSYCTLSALFSDWNRDGTLELRLSNDRQYYRGGQEQLWRVPVEGPPKLYGRSDGWRKLTIWGMGITSHDINDDGYPDYVLTSMGDNKLRILAKGALQPTYADAARKSGITAHQHYAGVD